MFTFWLNNCAEPTCELLIQAVDAMGRRDVVTMLRQKYYGELVVPEVIVNFMHSILVETLVPCGDRSLRFVSRYTSLVSYENVNTPTKRPYLKIPHILMVSSEERAVYITFRWKQASIDLSVHD